MPWPAAGPFRRHLPFGVEVLSRLCAVAAAAADHALAADLAALLAAAVAAEPGGGGGGANDIPLADVRGIVQAVRPTVICWCSCAVGALDDYYALRLSPACAVYRGAVLPAPT